MWDDIAYPILIDDTYLRSLATGKIFRLYSSNSKFEIPSAYLPDQKHRMLPQEPVDEFDPIVHPLHSDE